MTIDYPNRTPTLEEIESGGSFFVCFDQRGTPYLFNFREGHCWGLRRVARNEGVSREVILEAAGGDIADDGVNYDEIGGGDAGAESGDGGTGGGIAVDIGVNPVPIGQLDADLDQGTVRKSIRGLDQGAVAAIREVTGASSDAEAVRKAVALAKDALVKS